jgi:phosphocarrier protein HPr
MTSSAKATVEIVNELGLHARAATMLVQLASTFQSNLTISKDGEKVDGKSIMGVLLLAATRNSIVDIHATGPDCVELIKAVTDLVANGFGEDH